jgi:uncharacterized protein (TIGR02217 family)
MGFHEVQFPAGISYGSAGGPAYLTEIIEVDGGAEELVSRWSLPRRQYDVSYGIKSRADLAALQTFFIARMGAANGFRYKDWLDFTTSSDGQTFPTNADVILGTGDGTTTTFQLVKRYTSGAITRTRTLTKIVTGTTLVAINGSNQPTGWSVNENSGIITFTTPPPNGHTVTAGCQFDVPVRFAQDTDRLLSTSIEDYGSGSARGINLIEIIGDTVAQEEFFYGGSTVLDPLSADYTLSTANGRAIYVQPTAGTFKLILPNPATLPDGGPHFFLINGSVIDSVAVHYPSGTNLFTLAAQSGKTLVITRNGVNAKEWHWL